MANKNVEDGVFVFLLFFFCFCFAENLDSRIWGKYQCADICRMKMTCLVKLFDTTVSALDRVVEGLATRCQRE